MLKRLTWSLARQVGLQGLLPWVAHDGWLHVEQRDVFLPGLGADMDGVRLVHIADTHFGPLASQRHQLQYVDRINELEPDFIAITGDIVTYGVKRYMRQAGRVLGRLAPRVATLACLGNHDYGVWSPNIHKRTPGQAEFLTEQLAENDVTVLDNRSVTFQHGKTALHFVGVADLWSGEFNPNDAFFGVPTDQANITLCHNPDAAPDLLAAGAQCILAGHTHGLAVAKGKINDLFWPTENRQWISGFYPLQPGKWLYVNRGLGPGRRLREHHRPEITCLELRAGRAVETRTEKGRDRRDVLPVG